MIKYSNFFVYNSEVKISGNVITIKAYENSQQAGYIVQNTISKKMPNFYNILQNKLNETYISAIKSSIENKIEELISDDEKRLRFKKSLYRAKSNIFDLISCNANAHRDYNNNKQFTKFLTLTFKENITDITIANKYITDFFKRLSYNIFKVKTNVLKYIVVPELQERGAWHYHIILFNMPYVPFTNLLQVWNYGSVYITAIKKDADATQIAKYITKYIAKGISVKTNCKNTIINNDKELKGDKLLSDYDNYKKLNMQNKKRYSTSKGLIRPDKYKLTITRAELALLISYSVENRNKEHEVYFKQYENEYRGQVAITSVVLDQANLKHIKSFLKNLVSITHNKYAWEHKVNFKKIAEQRETLRNDNIKYRQQQKDIQDYTLYRALRYNDEVRYA